MLLLFSFIIIPLCLVHAQAGWKIIASDVGGGALGVAFFEDGLTGICATSQILPAGYEVKSSLDGGITWNTVNNTYHAFDGFYNVGAYAPFALVSSDFLVVRSNDTAATFVDDFAAPSGGQIVRKLSAADGHFFGFAIIGLTTAGDVNGAVTSSDGGSTWKKNDIQWEDPLIVALDGSFLNSSWTVVGNIYQTAMQVEGEGGKGRRRSPKQQQRRATAAVGKALYATEVATSTDGGASWTTVYSNQSIAALSLACIDGSHCCFVSEDADYSYIHCTSDGWATVQRAHADKDEGAAIVEIAVAAGTCAGGGDAYVAVGGDVAGAVQAPGFWRSCDLGQTYAKDATPSWPVADLLATDIDCQPHTPNGTQCWATLWDQGAIDPNTYVAKYFSS